MSVSSMSKCPVIGTNSQHASGKLLFAALNGINLKLCADRLVDNY